MMKKFPVTSVDGNEYLAEVYYEDYWMIGKVLVVQLYIKEEYKFFWKTKTKLTKVAEKIYEKNNGGEYHDVVMAVKHTVSSYEIKCKKAIEQEIHDKNLLERSKKEFEEWDGKC